MDTIARGLALRAPKVLAQSAVAVPHTGDTVETTLATITIPAGAMGANGRVIIHSMWSCTNPSGANTKTMRVKFGGTSIATTTSTAAVQQPMMTTVANRGSASSQVGTPSTGFASSSSAIPTPAIDTTAAVDITFTGICANAADTVTLESYQVILYPKT